ncbi:MAG: DUF1847 domain-containing protein [Pseudomonadota bacterium]|nr:DUF1847 domain-containing protein [Pseudomonadota bacterium]
MTEYSNEDIKRMNISSLACNKSRLKELITFAKLSGYRKIGIAHCITMQRYARQLKDILEKENFEVFDVGCRDSGLEGEAISPELKGPSCDPISQADYLNDCETDFNINVGQCLGHGLIFQKYSKADVTTIVVKDFETHHRSIQNFE